MPVPHDYYDHCSPEPHLHNRHNAAPYIEPDWQANIAKDQLPDLSTIGRGPKGDGLYIGDIRQDDVKMSFDIRSDLTNEVLATIGPFPTGGLKVYGDPIHDPVAGEEVKFYVDYSTYDPATGKIEVKTEELAVPPGATGSLIYLYDNVLTRTSDDTYQVDEDDLTIYNRKKYPQKPAVRVNDIIILETRTRIPATPTQKAYWKYWLTFGTVEAVKNGKVVFTARTFFDYAKARVAWDDIDGKPDFAAVATSGQYADLKNQPLKKENGKWSTKEPIDVSIFRNDAEYQTRQEVEDAIDSAVSAAYRYMGSVNTFEDLPSNPENGWVYNVRQKHGDTPAGTNYAYNANERRWDALGGDVDLSGLATEEYVDEKIAEIPPPVQSWDDIQDKPEFAEVATSGDFNDLANTPTDHVRRVFLTQEEYDALTVKDPYTIYVTNGSDADPSGPVVYVAENSEIVDAIDVVIDGRN